MKVGVLKLTSDKDDYDEIVLNGCMYRKVMPKRYVLPMPESEHMSMGHRLQSYAIHSSGKWVPREYNSNRDAEIAYGGTVTQSDLDEAPAWVKAIKPVEMTDDEQ
ncbi:MAG: hypothetical protein ABF912_13140 [Lacticaseibacillus paracasei]